MTKTEWADDPCPIARSLGVLGERWSMLIVRDAMLGSTRFSEFRTSLGIAPDILSARLTALVAAGVFETVEYQEPGARRRRRYELTTAGRELSTILASLAQWARTHLPPAEDNRNRFIDTTTKQQVLPCLRRSDGRLVDPADAVLVAPTAVN